MKKSIAIALCLTLASTIAIAGNRPAVLDDLHSHVEELTLVLIGRPEQKLPKVGDTPTFTKIFTGSRAFVTKNDRWFGSTGPSASDQQTDTNRMEKVIAVLSEASQMVKRTVLLADPVRHRFEGKATGLKCSAIAIGYSSTEETVVYYLIKIDDRQRAIDIFKKIKETMRAPKSSASTVVGNVLWRLER